MYVSRSRSRSSILGNLNTMADVRNTYIHFNKGMMSCIVLVLVLVGVVMSSGSSDEYEELDPFDMVNFDHVKMKMRKKTPIVEEVKPAENKPDSTPVQDPLPEMKDTEQSSPKQDDMQVPSPPPLDASEVKDCVGDETSKDPPAAVISCPALSLFQQFVSRLLRFVGDKVSKMDENSQTELCLRMHLTSRELEVLESFKNDQSRDQVFSAHDVLLEAIKGAHVVQSDDPSFHFLWFEEKLGMTVEKTFWVLLNVVLLVALAAVLSKLRFSWALVRWMTFISCLLSIGMTWFRLYKGELAKQHKTMMKDLPQGCTKLPEGSGRLDNLFNFFAHYFTFKQDACLEFYEHIFVDPIVKVSPMEALAVAVVQTVLKPMRTVGTEISEFLRALVKDLPVHWQMVTVVIVFSFFALVLFLTCGYRVKIPFLLAIEPASTLEQSQTEEVKALKTQLHELQAAVENIGAAGRSQEDIAMLQPSQSPAPQPLSPASHHCRATHVDGDKSMIKTTRPPVPEMGNRPLRSEANAPLLEAVPRALGHYQHVEKSGESSGLPQNSANQTGHIASEELSWSSDHRGEDSHTGANNTGSSGDSDREGSCVDVHDVSPMKERSRGAVGPFTVGGMDKTCCSGNADSG